MVFAMTCYCGPEYDNTVLWDILKRWGPIENRMSLDLFRYYRRNASAFNRILPAVLVIKIEIVYKLSLRDRCFSYVFVSIAVLFHASHPRKVNPNRMPPGNSKKNHRFLRRYVKQG
jgi:uncharacterized membrane protein (DUF4010 family)